MKKILAICCSIVILFFQVTKASAQSAEIQQLILDVEKLTQFKGILSDMKRGYQILEGGYNAVKGVAQGNFNLHKVFLDGLTQVSPTVRNYKRVADIVNYQIALAKEYSNAYNRFKREGNFSPNELDYMGRVYGNLFKESLRNLDDLLTVITANKARMGDDERLQSIDRIYAEMQDKLMFLRQFNNSASILSIQRMKEKNDTHTMQKTLGVNGK